MVNSGLKFPRYCVEYNSIVLFDEKNSRSLTLHYPQAAVWDLLSRGFNQEQIIERLTLIGQLTPNHASEIIDDFCAMLVKEGFAPLLQNGSEE